MLTPLVIGAARLAVRAVRAVDKAIQNPVFEEEARKAEEEARRWESGVEEILRLLEEAARKNRERRQETAGERPTVATEPNSFFKNLGIDLEKLKQLPVDQRGRKVSRYRIAVALLLEDGLEDRNAEVWAKLNSQLDEVDPRFDENRTTGSQEETRKPQPGDVHKNGTEIV